MALPQLFADDIRALRQGMDGFLAGSERERMIRLADRAARSAVPVLIESEPGSGAQALVRAIHDCSERKDRPFVRFHADEAFPDESALDAAFAKQLQDAHGGTLCIQDVHRLTADAQKRLFDLLSGSEAPRKGRRSARADVRIVATTEFRLADLVKEGRFREDLYYRLQALPITLLPLRAQRGAIAELAGVFLHRFAAEEGKRIKGLSPEAAMLLMRYDWPGNLRQLENAVFRAVVLAEGPLLTPAEFPQIAAHVEGYRVEIPPVPTGKALGPFREAASRETSDPHALPLVRENGEMRTLAELEEQAIRFALIHYQGRLSAISRRLGIGRSTLYRKLKELGIDDAAA